MTNSTQEEWREKTLDFVAAVNRHVARGLADGWENAGPEPIDPGREHLASAALDAVRLANQNGQRSGLRERWPPAHAPLIPFLEENGQNLPTVCILPDRSIVARVGAPWERGRVVHIVDDEVREVPDVEFFGRCPNRRFFAIAREDGVEVTDGWNGPRKAMCRWPAGQEGLPRGLRVPAWESPPPPTRLIPFPNGKRVLFISSGGIFVLTKSTARRLSPTRRELREYFRSMQAEHPGAELDVSLSMEHGAISTDGKLIAIGAQDGNHLVFNDWLEQIGEIGRASEYPHHALFSEDESLIAFNSCHFYNGVTIGVPTSLLPGLTTEPYAPDDRTPILQDGARVYASVSRKDEFIVGDAAGYVLAFGHDGKPHWQQFIGSSVCDMDLTPDGQLLAVSTCAGFLALIHLDAGTPPPWQIGTGTHVEFRRWLFFKNEPQPLIW